MKHIIFKLSKIFATYRQILLYLVFGVCTTMINTVCYWLLYDILACGNVASTIFAWVTAVIFAFITNKLLVFESRRSSKSERVGEVVSFFGCRLITGVLDVVIMAVAVDLLMWNGLLWKLISNIIVTVLNYIASKFWIFKELPKAEEETGVQE